MKTKHAEAGPERIFPGNSEMAQRMRAFDWSHTSLGPPRMWPENLRTVVNVCLTSRIPILVLWGPDLSMLYNDAYISFLGNAKHPRYLSKPVRECWREIWNVIGPMLDGVMKTGEATWSDDLPLFFDRKLSQEEVYVRFTYGPILAADGCTVDGIFSPGTETTGQVVGTRQLETLRALGVKDAEARTVDAACKHAAAVLAANPRDVAFSAIYVVDQAGTHANLIAASAERDGDSPGGDSPFPATVSLVDGKSSSWPFTAILSTKHGEEVDLEGLGLRLPGGAWPERAAKALMLPVCGTTNHDVIGFLIVGVSPRRVLDAPYRTFFDLVARHIGTVVVDALAYDVERKRAEALAEVDRAKTAFFSNISHELRTPLTLMLGPLEDMLDSPGSIAPESRELLSFVHRNGQRLLKLVNTLLDFARIEAGRSHASYEATDLSTFTKDLASLFRSSIEKAGMRLVVDASTLPQPVYVDRDMWEKVVLNLVSNASKYTLQGEIRVEMRADKDSAVLSVRDTGAGIPQTELPKLFSRFYRAHGTLGRSREGTGIGLSLVAELVKLHGGTIEVRSDVGKGSAFTVHIPFGRAHLSASHTRAMQTAALMSSGAAAFAIEAEQWLSHNGGGRTAIDMPDLPRNAARAVTGGESKATVLVADDNADMRAYLQRSLEREYQIITVADGQQALQAALQHQPDLVLADVMMPGLNGLELLKAMRAEKATAATSVLLLSARAGDEALIEGLQAGADAYMIKPFNGRELRARVGGLIELAAFRRKAIHQEQDLREQTVSILEGMNEGFASVDADWRITYVNAAAESLSHMSRERLIGMNHWEAFPAAVGTLVEREYRRAMISRLPVRFENYFAPYGRWQEICASPLKDGGLLLYAHDITDRKLAEEALHATEARLTVELEAMSQLHDLSTQLLASPDLQSALDEVLDASIAMLGAGMGTIQLYNPQTRVLEIASHRGFRQDFLDFFRSVNAEGSSASALALRSGKRVIITDVQADPAYHAYRQIAASAGYRAVQSTPLMRSDGQPLGILSTHFRKPHRPSERDLRMLDLYAHQATDFIQRIRFEEALGESEARFRALAEASPAQIWQSDAKGNVVYANPRYQDRLGVAPEEIMGSGWLPIMHPDDVRPATAAFEQAQRERTRFHHRLRLKDKEGGWHWFESHASPLFNAEGEYTGHVGISIDITEMVRSEEALKEARRRKDEFLSVLVHELRNPLAAIDYVMQMLKHAGGAGTADRLNEIVTRQVSQIARLVDDLLEVSRITEGRFQLHNATIDLATVVRSAVEMSKIAIERAGQQLTISLPAEPLMLDADAVRLAQVFVNLLDNAARYSEEGGKIRLVASREADHVTVSVRDEGIGIASDKLADVFDNFAYADRAPRAGHGGLGIGLSLVRTIMEMHGGSVEVRSEGPGTGSEFIVRLPLAETVQTEKGVEALEQPASGLARQRILVVDDNVDAADSLAMLLKFLGAEVHVANDGTVALAALERWRPNVVLMDIVMPGMDGYELTRRIRQQPRFNNVMLIALTGWEQEERRRSQADGFEYYLTKPVDVSVLQALLNSPKLAQ